MMLRVLGDTRAERLPLPGAAPWRKGKGAPDWRALLKSVREGAVYIMPNASLYISRTASSSAMSSLSRLRRAITLRMTLVS